MRKFYLYVKSGYVIIPMRTARYNINTAISEKKTREIQKEQKEKPFNDIQRMLTVVDKRTSIGKWLSTATLVYFSLEEEKDYNSCKLQRKAFTRSSQLSKKN